MFLNGQVAVLTCAGRGITAAIAKAFAAAGANLVAAAAIRAQRKGFFVREGLNL